MKPVAFRTCFAALCWALSCATPARADIYICRDANGQLSSSDHMTQDCLNYGGKIVGPDGTVRSRILTTKEQAQAMQAREAAEIAARQQRDKERQDRALLLRYPNRQALEQAHQTDLERPTQLIAQAKRQLGQLQQQLRRLQADAQFYPQGPLPLDLRTKFEENRVLTQQAHELISGQEAEIARIDRNYAALQTRLQPLWARRADAAGR